MKKQIIAYTSLLAMTLLYGPVFAADAGGRGWIKGQGVTHGKGAFKGSGVASGTGVVVYRDHNGHVRYKRGTGTVSGRGIAVGRGTVAGRGRGMGKGHARGHGRRGHR